MPLVPGLTPTFYFNWALSEIEGASRSPNDPISSQDWQVLEGGFYHDWTGRLIATFKFPRALTTIFPQFSHWNSIGP